MGVAGKPVTVTVPLIVDVPLLPVTDNSTVLIPGVEYVTTGLAPTIVTNVAGLAPLPKFQKQPVMEPEDVFTNVKPVMEAVLKHKATFPPNTE